MQTDDVKTLYWVGTSKKDFKAFPIPVQKSLGLDLFIVQSGRWPDSVKPWKGLGPGIYELVDDEQGNTYRAVYALRFGNAIHVLHAFQKSPSRVSARRAPTSI